MKDQSHCYKNILHQYMINQIIVIRGLIKDTYTSSSGGRLRHPIQLFCTLIREGLNIPGDNFGVSVLSPLAAPTVSFKFQLITRIQWPRIKGKKKHFCLIPWDMLLSEISETHLIFETNTKQTCPFLLCYKHAI